MTELNNRQADTAVAENPVIAGWQKDSFEEGDRVARSRQPRILGGVHLSGSGNYCASMDLIHQHELRAC